MNLEAILNKFTHNVESIIQWLFLFILALSGFLISRWLLFKKSEGPGQNQMTAGAGPEVSGILQQILDRTAKLDGANVTAMSPEQAALAETQVQGLKKELSAREDELKALKAAGGGNTGEADKLSGRLKELEAKLAEYEILEDDIADLSLYKEENLRLRGELDKLRNAGGGAAAPAASAPVEVAASDVEAAIAAAGAATEAPAPAPAAPAAVADAGPVPPGHDIVAEFASAVTAEAIPTPEITMQVPDTGNPMKDFEAAVQIEQKMKGTTPAAPQGVPASVGGSATPPAPAAAQAAAPAAAAPAAAAKGESDDLFAEFTESPNTEIDTSSLDTDKMMAEMAALVNLDPSASSLDEGIDVEKMALEATGTNAKR